jgi:UDPglucose 6-dehydrogenase
MKVAVIGAGYVGLVSASCLAEMGNEVTVLEVDPARVQALQRGVSPIHEPGLDDLLERNLKSGRLAFTTDPQRAISGAPCVFIAVGTPAAEDGSADLRHVLAAAECIGAHLDGRTVIVNKSTVPVGSAERVREVVRRALLARGVALPFAVVSNPEFLKEGAAVADFLRPDRVILGGSDERALELMRGLYAPFVRNRDRILMMDERSAELSKYAANAMLATRISFMNEIANLAEELGADIEQVRVGIGSDHRIGTHFLYAGCGWGGSCFPKDVRALHWMGQDSQVDMPLLAATQEVNQRQRRLLAQRVFARFGRKLDAVTVAVWGLAFKPGTDDLREAPSATVIGELLEHGANIHAYDPVAGPKAAREWPGHTRLRYGVDPYEVAQDADALLVFTEWREFRSPDFGRLHRAMRQPVVFDGRNLYDTARMQAMGFEYLGVGRPAASASRSARAALVA